MNKFRNCFITLLLTLLVTPLVWAADLMTVYQHALQNDPEYRAAQAKYLSDGQLVPISRGDLLPQIDFQTNVSTSVRETDGNDVSHKDHDYGITLSQTIFNLTQWSALNRSQAQKKQADAVYADAVQKLIVRVATAYFDVLKARDELIFTQAEKLSIGERLEDTRQRYQVGLRPVTDVYEAQANYDTTVANEIKARNDLAKKLEDLRKLTGMGYEQLAPIMDELPLVTPTPENIDAWVSITTQQNLNLIAKGHALEAARQLVKNKKAGHWPTLKATGSWNNAYSQRTSNRIINRTVGATLDFPIFRGGSTTASSKQARYDYNEADAVREQAFRDAINDTRQAYLDVVTGISRIQANKQRIESTSSQLQATQAAYQVGTRTMVDILDSQTKLFNAQRAHANDQYEYILNGLALKQAAGILEVRDMQSVNGLLSTQFVEVVPVQQEVDTSATEALVDALTQVERTEDEQELLSVDPENYILELFVTDDLTELQDFIAQSGLVEHILYYRQPELDTDTMRYVVLYGMYDSYQIALDALNNLPDILDAYSPEIRTVESVQLDILYRATEDIT